MSKILYPYIYNIYMEGYSRVKDDANIMLHKFSSNKYIAGTQEFLDSNSIVATFAFIILVFIMFVILLRLGGSFLTWIFSSAEDPVLIDGMIDAEQMVIIPQDPTVSGSIPVLRSVNDVTGIEFTWSVWMYIDNFQYKMNDYKHVFHKGNDNISLSGANIGLNYPNNAPGLYITPNTNNLLVLMNTFDNIKEEVIIKDIPLNKWINVIIRMSAQNQLDVYINGALVKRHILSGVPKQNYGNVYASMNGGFSGYTSELQYFNTAIGMNKIQSIVDTGPDMTMKGAGLTKSKPHYLSTRWYFSGMRDMYNP
jgi:hypothetical protein